MTGSVARAVGHFQIDIAEMHGIAVVQPAIRLEGLQRRHAKALPLSGQLIDPELVINMRPLDLHAMAARKLGGLTAMIDMPMGQQDLLELAARGLERLVDAIEVAARVDRHRLPGGLIDQDRAVLLKRGHWHDHQFHGGVVRVDRSVGVAMALGALTPGMGEQRLQRHDAKRHLVGRLEHHWRRHACFVGF